MLVAEIQPVATIAGYGNRAQCPQPCPATINMRYVCVCDNLDSKRLIFMGIDVHEQKRSMPYDLFRRLHFSETDSNSRFRIYESCGKCNCLLTFQERCVYIKHKAVLIFTSCRLLNVKKIMENKGCGSLTFHQRQRKFFGEGSFATTDRQGSRNTP